MIKVYKKILLAAVMFFGLVSSVVFAENGDIIGHVYSTDILTYVNGKSIEGKNIGGETVVIAEDLCGGSGYNYGFNLYYNDEERHLYIYCTFYESSDNPPEIARGTVGKIEGNVYESDISVTFNNVEINGLNIGGKTAICLEDLGEISADPNGAYGFSKYLGKTKWDDQSRIISFESYMQNEKVLYTDELTRVEYTFSDNVLYVWQNDLKYRAEITPNLGGSFAPTGLEEGADTYLYSYDFDEKNHLSPLYLSVNGEKTQIGTVVCVYDTQSMLSYTAMNISETDTAYELIKSVRSSKKTYTEAYNFFENKFSITDVLEYEKYTVMTVKTEMGGSYIALLNKDGGYAVVEDHSNEPETLITLEKDDFRKNELIVGNSLFSGMNGATSLKVTYNLESFNFE